MCPLSGHVEGVSEVKVRLPLPTSIVITPVVDKLQECGKEQWIAEGLLQLWSRLFNEKPQRDS